MVDAVKDALATHRAAAVAVAAVALLAAVVLVDASSEAVFSGSYSASSIAAELEAVTVAALEVSASSITLASVTVAVVVDFSSVARQPTQRSRLIRWKRLLLTNVAAVQAVSTSTTRSVPSTVRPGSKAASLAN